MTNLKNFSILIRNTFLVITIISATLLNAQKDISFRPDTAVTIGTLDNGLTYYIRQNSKPEQSLQLRLVVKAGSILETDGQLGLAHFCEHMAFNGTEHFEGNELIYALERMGVKFGADLNASTGFDQTIYEIEVPTDQTSNLDTAFLILTDWAGGVGFDAEEIDKERGVIMSEWRSSKGARTRLRDKLIPKLLYESRYANRLPIGDTAILQNFERDTIVSFYRNWYRPDLMAVVAVGDVDKAELEWMVHKYFKHLTNPANAPERVNYDIESHDSTFLIKHSDPEITSKSFEILMTEKAEKGFSYASYKEDIIESLFVSIINERLADIGREANPPFQKARIRSGSLTTNASLSSVYIQPIDNDYLGGLVVVMEELERIAQNGVLPSELERVIAEKINFRKKSLKNLSEKKSRLYATEYLSSFLLDKPVYSDSSEFEVYTSICDSLTVEDLKGYEARWRKQNGRVLLFETPEKDSAAIPAYEEVIQYIDKVSYPQLSQIEDVSFGEELFSEELLPASITKEKYNKKFDITEIELSNGVKVALKPTDYTKDFIQFRALSPGGNSLLPDSLFLTSAMVTSVVQSSGIGNFSRSDLNKFLKGKEASVFSAVNTYNEGMVGNSDHENLELMLQMAYMYFTNARRDSVAFDKEKRDMILKYQDANNSPGSYFADTTTKILYGNHPRLQGIPVIADIEVIQQDDIYSIYADRFADASDFTFIFIGDFEVDEVKPVIVKYLGALPSINRKEEPADLHIDIKAKEPLYKVYKGIDDEIATVKFYYRGEFTPDVEDEIFYRAADELIQMRLLKTLREDMGQIYSVSVRSSSAQVPKPVYLSQIAFRCAPKDAETLIEVTKQVIDSIAVENISQENIDKIKAQMLQAEAKKQKSNIFWIRNLKKHYESGAKLKDLTHREKFIKQIDKKKIEQAVHQYFNSDKAVCFILYPEDVKSIY